MATVELVIRSMDVVSGEFRNSLIQLGTVQNLIILHTYYPTLTGKQLLADYGSSFFNGGWRHVRWLAFAFYASFDITPANIDKTLRTCRKYYNEYPPILG